MRRYASRINRFKRFRDVAFRVLLPTAKPTTIAGFSSPRGNRTIYEHENSLSAILFPCMYNSRKCLCPRRTSDFLNVWRTHLAVDYPKELFFVAHRQFPSPFSTTASKDSASVFRFHSFTKSMLIFPLTITRLECPLHEYSLTYNWR